MRFFCAVTLLCLALARPAASQSYTFTRILDGATPRPGGVELFNPAFAFTTPNFDGQWIVFRDAGPINDSLGHVAIFSYDTVGKQFYKLAEITSPLPGGTTINDLHLNDTAPVVIGGMALFVATDSTGRQGLYSVPVTGGAITRVADYNTPDPSGGTFDVFDSYSKRLGAFSFDGTTVAFNANGSQLTVGNYTATPEGTSITMVADSRNPYAAPGANVATFKTPLIAGSNVVMTGSGVTDPLTGYNGLYLGSVGGNGAVTELVNSAQPLPDDPTAGFHTRFDAPVVAFDGTLVAFRADDTRSATAFFGLYRTDLTSHTIGKIVDVNSTLPGLAKLSLIATYGVSASQGSILFQAGDNQGQSGLYIWKNGAIARIVGSGDVLDGRVVTVDDPGGFSLSGSNFVFKADFGAPFGPALYLATASAAVPAIASVMNRASGAAGSIAPGEIVTVAGTGLGPAAQSIFQLDANNRIPSNLSGTEILIGGLPSPVIYASDTQVTAIAPFGITGQATADVVARYNGNASAPVAAPVTNTMPGIFSLDGTGSGQGAIQNADGSINGVGNPAAGDSIIVLYLAGLGQINPPEADGSVSPGTEPWPTLQFPVTATIGGQNAEVIYQGPAPLAVAGLYQVNCRIPAGTPSGPAAVVVTGDNLPSQPNLTVAVQ